MKLTKIFVSLALSLLIVLLAGSAFGKTNLGLFGVGGRLGYIMPEDPIDNAFNLGVIADLGTIIPSLHLEAYLDYWGKSYDVGDFEWSWSVIGLGAVVKYYFKMDSKIQPYAGGGLGLDFFSTKVENAGSDSSIEFALRLLGGAQMPLTPKIDGFAQLMFSTSDIDYFGIFLGAVYKLK